MNPPSLLTVQNCYPSCRVRDLEDERRIAYVGMARARVSLGLRYAAERYGDNVRPRPGPGSPVCDLGHESNYAPVITRQRKEPCP
jgi:superfamily I DNA/RNA helicase